MNFTLVWNKSDKALVLTFFYPFETEPGVQKESVEIYTKFQGYRALQGIIHRSEENGHKLLPEELFLFWKSFAKNYSRK